MVLAPGARFGVICLAMQWGSAVIGCCAIVSDVAGIAGGWFSWLSVCWAYGGLVDGLWLVVLGTVKGCWVGGTKVCGDGLELVCFCCQVRVIGCSIGGWPCWLHGDVYFIMGVCGLVGCDHKRFHPKPVAIFL